MPFRIKLITVRMVDFRQWSIQESLTYQGKRESWTVPRGFITDFASVPRFASWLVPITGVYTLAAILHDWFCSYAIQAGIISARDADGVFRRIMREEGVPPLLRWLVWTAVRWGALKNPVRRAEWWKDAPLVLLLTLVFLPFVAPALIATGLGLLVWSVLEMAVYLVGKGVSLLPGKKYRSIKRPRMYEALRRRGMSKRQAARISNSRKRRRRKKR